MNTIYKWFAITVPIRKEEYISKQINDLIKENNISEIGPSIVPTSFSFGNEKGKVVKQTKQLRGFIFIKSLVTKDKNGTFVSPESLYKLLNNFPKLRLQLEPFDESELDKILNQNKQDTKETQEKVISGFAKGCLIKSIYKKDNSENYMVEVITFGRSIVIELTKEELGK